MFISYRAMNDRVVSAMREAGYDVTVAQARLAQRMPDPEDGRSKLIRFTERGRAASQHALEVVRDVERERAEHLGPEGAAQLRQGLLQLREVTDPYR